MIIGDGPSVSRLPVPGDLNWSSVNVAKVNGNAVQFRTMKDATAPWHVHADSDELFFVLTGTVIVETDECAHQLNEQEFFVVPAGVKHRSRVEGLATLLVIINVDE